jgi:prefoldin subunit 5
MPDAGVAHLHDRLNYLDSRISELRSVILTKDSYVERRNREDLYIRREFETQRTICERIDVGVTILKTELNQIRNSVSSLNGDTAFLRNDVARLQKNVQQLQVDTAFLRNDVTRLQKNVQQIQVELEALKTEVGGCRTEIKQLHTTVQQLHTAVNQSERVRFNSLATTVHAPINAVPKIDQDGSLRYPDYFPRTVWRFWCLKKRSRIHRLVELAEFYEVEGYEYWGRNHQDDVPWDDDEDSSDYSDRPNSLTRAEAAYQYPEACHQALAATLGLNYHKIRKAVGESPNSRIASAPKRPAEDVVSNPHVSSRPKPVKFARRLGDVSPTMLQKLVYGVPSVASKSISSELDDKLVWREHGREGSEISDEALSKLKGLSSDIGSILRAIERGKLYVKSEQMHVSPTESHARAEIKGESPDASPMAVEEEARSTHTVSTEIISPTGSLPDTASMLS